jgi:hypothetical protein
MDNADGDDNRDLLREFLPNTNRGSVLVTSRDKNLISQFKGHELNELDEDNAVRLLKSLTNFNQSRLTTERLKEEEEAAAAKIVEQIGYLPLGIHQAANVIVSDACRLTAFLSAYNNMELIEDSQEIRLIKQASTTYPYSLRTVWKMNFERLNADQRSLLNVMAFLDPDRVQERLLNDGGNDTPNPGLRFISTAHKVHKHIVALLRSSLISQNDELHELGMHRLVQAACHLQMTHQERQKHFLLAVSLIKQSWPVPPRTAVHNPSLWPDQQAFLPHVQSLCRYYVESRRNGIPLIPDDVVDWSFPSILYEAGW